MTQKIPGVRNRNSRHGFLRNPDLFVRSGSGHENFFRLRDFDDGFCGADDLANDVVKGLRFERDFNSVDDLEKLDENIDWKEKGLNMMRGGHHAIHELMKT